jgi:signal transduction histidine kinase
VNAAWNELRTRAEGSGGEPMTEPDNFQDYLATRNLRAARLTSVLVAVLGLSGVVLDYFMHREQLLPLFGLRLGAAAVAGVCFWLSRLDGARSYAFALGVAPVLGTAIAIEVMVESLEGYSSPYYAGLTHCLLGLGVIFYWTVGQIVFACSLVLLIWLVPTLSHASAIEAGPFVNNFFALGISAAIAVASNGSRFASVQREYSSRSDLMKALERLKEIDHAKNQFFANITHELKTPLTMILAPLELMLADEMGRLSEIQRASLQSMLRSGVKLLKLIGDLLDLSKLNESRLRLQVGEHDLVSYLRSLTSQVQSLAHRKSIDLAFETNVDSCSVFCDLDKLERVFVNLLSNAAKFTPANGHIRVILRDDGERARISVVDDGIGFPPEMAETIFERFVQVDTGGTRKFGGTGIGLSLARELVHLHGGELNAASDGSSGATFTVELLKDRGHLHPGRIDRRARQEDRLVGKRETDHGLGEWQVEAQGQFRFIDIDEATDQRVVGRDLDENDRPESVLVVEDTPDVIRVIHLALRSHFRVLAAPGGQKGFELAAKHLPSLIITDLMMPEVDGNELARMLRADVRTRHIPIVMLTARGDVDDRVAGLESGVNAYLTKPFSTKELVSTVRGLVRIQEATADLVLTHSMDSLETIAGGLAHEINNPLNYIKTALTLIQTDAQTLLAHGTDHTGAPPPNGKPGGLASIAARMEKMFGVAEVGLRRIGSTVLLMQRYAREGYSRVLQPLDVFEAATDVVTMLNTDAALRVETSFEGNGHIECVPEEFNQVLTNLIQNAIDAVPHDGTGRVRVAGSRSGGLVIVSVQDNGPGIPADARSRIFTPFYTTKEVGKGMGLGLTIVRRVVLSLGGTVDVASSASGTEFTLRIPHAARPSEGTTTSATLSVVTAAAGES